MKKTKPAPAKKAPTPMPEVEEVEVANVFIDKVMEAFNPVINTHCLVYPEDDDDSMETTTTTEPEVEEVGEVDFDFYLNPENL